MTAVEAAAAMARGVGRALPGAAYLTVPLADGGEGFAAALAAALGGRFVPVTVHDARGREAVALLLLAGEVAVVEVAQAVGLAMIPPDERDVVSASTVGVGELIRAALDLGARRIIVGLGGSSTNDGGAGMLSVLGVRFRDEEGGELAPVPRELARVADIDVGDVDSRLADVRIEAACDVTAPLCGPGGASAVFGPQKGATPEQVVALDATLARLAEVSGRGRVADLPGSGAAGGLGWALLAFLGARARPGIELVAEVTGLAAAVSGADLVLTGEGSVDAQTLSGKTVAGVVALAAGCGVPVVVLAGRVSPEAQALLDRGVVALVPINEATTDLPTALARGAVNLESATARFLAGWAEHRPRGRSS